MTNQSEDYRRECEVRYWLKKWNAKRIVPWAIKKGDKYCKTLATELVIVLKSTELERRLNTLEWDDKFAFKPYIEAAKNEREERQRENQRLRDRHGAKNLSTARSALA